MLRKEAKVARHKPGALCGHICRAGLERLLPLETRILRGETFFPIPRQARRSLNAQW